MKQEAHLNEFRKLLWKGHFRTFPFWLHIFSNY